MRADQDEASAVLDGLDLDTLLAALTRTRGYDAALRDPPGRRGWSDVKPGSINFLDLDERIDRLARLLAINKGTPGASVAILAPLGPEAIISILASLRAGLSPLMLPLHGNELELLALIEASGAVMAVGVSRVGPLRPLLTLRNLAMRAFGTRFVGGLHHRHQHRTRPHIQHLLEHHRVVPGHPHHGLDVGIRRKRLQLRQHGRQRVRTVLAIDHQPVESRARAHLGAVRVGQPHPQADLRLAFQQVLFEAVVQHGHRAWPREA